MAVDALVALAILASTIVFGLAAVQQGLRAARAGLEVRQANELLAYLLETTHTAAGVTEGQTDLFHWRLVVDDPLPSAAAATLCRHSLSVTNLRTSRNYTALTNEICPAVVS